jgi:hypothetical protein
MHTTSALQNLRRLLQIIILGLRLRKALHVSGNFSIHPSNDRPKKDQGL